MPITTLVTLLSVIVALIAVRVVVFKCVKPSPEPPAPSVETTTAQATGETLPEVSIWSVVMLVGIIVNLVVGLIVFGNVIGG